MAMKRLLKLALLSLVLFPLCKALTVQAGVPTIVADPPLQGIGYVLTKHIRWGRIRHRSTPTPTPSPRPTRTPSPTPTVTPSPSPTPAPSPSPTPGGIAPIRAND